MAFEELERKYYVLKGKHAAGLLSYKEFQAEVDRLTLQDSEGRWWTIGARTGKWYLSQEGEWVEAEPPPVTRPKPTITAVLPVAKRPHGGLLIGVIGLLFLCCLSGVALGAYEYLSPTKPLGTFISSLLAQPTPSPTPMRVVEATPTPTFTPGLPATPTPTLTATPTPSPTATAEVEMTAYHSESLGLSLDYPTDWQVTEAENAVFFSPAGVGLEILGEPAFGVGVYSGEAGSVQGITDEWLAALPEDAEVSPTTQVATPSHAWQMVQASFVDPYLEIAKRTYYGATVWEGTLYIFISESPPEQWATYEPIFFQMILSIELAGPALQPTATVAPTATPTAIPTPTLLPTATPAMQLLFQDDFSDRSGGWNEGDWEGSSIWIEDGDYHVLVKKAYTGTSGWRMETSYADLIFEADARQVSGPDNNAYGLLFRYKNKDNFYRFSISGLGKYEIDKRLEGEWVSIKKWTPSEAINQGVAANHLKVICQGNTIEVYVNDQHLATVTDDSFSEGYIALTAAAYEEPDVHVAFDNVKIWEVAD